MKHTIYTISTLGSTNNKYLEIGVSTVINLW